MNNRIISILLTISLILCFSSIIVDAKDSADYSKALKLLTGLSIGTLTDENAEISRGEFSQCISDILNYSSRPVNKNGNFKDVTVKDENSGAVYDLFARKIVSGYSTETFGLKNPISYEQAVKILVTTLGYNIVAEQRGGYPSGYMIIAHELRLLNNIKLKNGDKLSQGEAAQLIANALNAQVQVQTIFGDREHFETYEGTTLLLEAAGIQKIVGVVTDNGTTALTGKSNIGEKQLKIDSIVCDITDTEGQEYLGYKVEAYVDVKDVDSLKLLYIKCGERVEATEVDARWLLSDDPNFSLTNIVYSNIYGEIVNARIDSRADYIYNGNAYVDLKTNDLKIAYGTIVLVDNNSDGVNDVVFVNNVRTILVGGVNSEYGIIYDKLSSDNLVLDNKKNITIYKNGEKSDITHITEWDVITAYISKDGTSMELYASDKRVVGNVDEYSKDDGAVLVDGYYYNVTDFSILENIKLGDSHEFCLDANGNIAVLYARRYSNENVAYFVDAAIKDGLSHVVQVKLFMQDGIHRVFNCTNKVCIDGDSDKTADEVISYLKNYAAQNLVEFRLNENEEIKEIKLPYIGVTESENDKTALCMYYDTGDTLAYYSVNQQSFAGKVVLSSKTTVFQVPIDPNAPDKDYSVKTTSYFRNQNGYKFSAYTIGIEDGRADYLVMKADSKPEYTTSATPIVVSEIKNVLDDEGEIRECIIGYNNTGETELMAEDTNMFINAGIKKGDIIRCPLNIQGRAIDVRKIFDATSKVLVNDADTSANYWNNYRSFVGNVYSKYQTLLGITTANISSASIESIKSDLEYHDVSSTRIYVVDTSQKEVVIPGTVNDVYDYIGMGDNYSKIYLYSSDSNPRLLVVYK